MTSLPMIQEEASALKASLSATYFPLQVFRCFWGDITGCHATGEATLLLLQLIHNVFEEFDVFVQVYRACQLIVV